MNKKLFIIIYFICVIIPTIAYGQNVVTLNPQNDVQHIYLQGTTKSSGPQSVLYGYRHLLRPTNDPYTFYNEICISYSFSYEDKGRGRILNVTNQNANVYVVFYDIYGNAIETRNIEVKPRTFSRIMPPKNGTTCGFVQCSLTALY